VKPFAFARPADVAEAVRTVAAEPGAVFLGGGTNLVDHLKLGVARPDLVVDVRRLTSREVVDLGDGGVRIGAAVTNAELAADRRVRERYPVLAQALLSGATGQLRNLATTGGNPLQRTRCVYFQDVTTACNKREPGSGCTAVGGSTRNHAILGTAGVPDPTAAGTCIATHPSDMAVALAALDAVVHVQGPAGERQVPFQELHRLPDEDPSRDTVLEHGELITAIDLPPLPAGARSAYRKVRDRASYAFALVSVAAVVPRDGEIRLALGGVAHKPWRAHRAEEMLRDAALTEDAVRAAMEAELGVAQPQPGIDGGNGFKIPLVARTVVATVRDLAPEA